MPEPIKVQHLMRGLDPSLLVKVFPFLPLDADSKEFIRQVKVQCQASQLSVRYSLLQTNPVPQFNSIWSTNQPTPTASPVQVAPVPSFVAVPSACSLEESRASFETRVMEEMKEMRKEFAKELNADRQFFMEMLKQVANPNQASSSSSSGSSSKGPSTPGSVKYKRTHDGRPINAGCGKPGHIALLCQDGEEGRGERNRCLCRTTCD